MSTETLEVQARESLGSLATRKLRQNGQTPANLYGNGGENVNLAVNSTILGRLIQQGVKTFTLTGSVSETVQLKEVQWDTFGVDVLHVDFTRVS